MSEKTTRVIGWVLAEILCVSIIFFILFYGFSEEALPWYFYVGIGILMIPPLIIAFALGRSSVSLPKDPVELLQQAFRYANKVREEEDKKEKGKVSSL